MANESCLPTDNQRPRFPSCPENEKVSGDENLNGDDNGSRKRAPRGVEGVNCVALSALKSVRRRRGSRPAENSISERTSTPSEFSVTDSMSKQNEIDAPAKARFIERKKSYISWECKICQKACIPIRDESRCMCGHRLKAHDEIGDANLKR